MTTAVAVRAGGRIAIAADSRETFGDVTRETIVCKIVKLGHRCYAAGAGPGSVTQAFAGYAMRGKRVCFRDSHEIRDYALDFMRATRETGEFVRDQESNENTVVPMIGAGWVIISPHGVWDFGPDFGVTEYGDFTAIGTGWRFAIGAMSATHNPRGNARAFARRAVEVASKHCIYTGGRIDVVSVREAR